MEDGPKVYDLVRRSPPLDLNSRYAYFLLADHFSKTGVVVEKAGDVVGFLGGYRPPETSDALFVWQMAVDEAMRGKRLARAMILSILSRPDSLDITKVQATVGPGNAASRKVFESLATELNASFVAHPYLEAEAFGGAGHEPEIMLTVGPFILPQSQDQ